MTGLHVTERQVKDPIDLTYLLRTLDRRTDVVINVEDYGNGKVVGAGNDDSAAFNRAFDALRALATTGDAFDPTYHASVIFPNGRYRADNPINATGISGFGWSVVGDGSIILGHASGKAILDMLASRWGRIRDLTIVGDGTDTPKFGLQMGRISSASADRNTLDNVHIIGAFSKACLYNYASETALFNNINLYNEHDDTGGSYCLIQDANNDFGLASDYQTITAAAGTAASFNENTFINLDARKSTSGRTIYIGRQASRHRFINSYAVSMDAEAVELDMAAGGALDLYFDLHAETNTATPGIKSTFRFKANNGSATPIYKGFTYIDHAPHASDEIFDAQDLTSIEFRDLNLVLPTFADTLSNGVFSPKAKFSVYGGTLYVGDGAKLTNLAAMVCSIITGDRDDITYGVGSQFVVDATNTQQAVKGELRIYDKADASAGPGNLGNFGILRLIGTGPVLPTFTDATRGAAGTKGRVIFNDTDGQMNIDNGTNWTLPDGTVT